MDITNGQAVEKALSTKQYHFLINCSAYTAVDKAESDRGDGLHGECRGHENIGGSLPQVWYKTSTSPPIMCSMGKLAYPAKEDQGHQSAVGLRGFQTLGQLCGMRKDLGAGNVKQNATEATTAPAAQLNSAAPAGKTIYVLGPTPITY